MGGADRGRFAPIGKCAAGSKVAKNDWQAGLAVVFVVVSLVFVAVVVVVVVVVGVGVGVVVAALWLWLLLRWR